MTEISRMWKRIKDLDDQIKAFGIEMDRIEQKIDDLSINYIFPLVRYLRENVEKTEILETKLVKWSEAVKLNTNSIIQLEVHKDDWKTLETKIGYLEKLLKYNNLWGDMND